jgi:hypothetical protein
VPVVHPVADEVGDGYQVYAASARTVLLTEPLSAFLDCAVSERLRPVLLTDVGARLSPVVSLAMRRCGGYWAVQTTEGAFDALSGYRIESFADLWARSGTDRPRLPGFDRAGAGIGVLMFDVYAHHRAEASTRIGPLARTAVAGLGGSDLDVWGRVEPLVTAWDETDLTQAVRRGMPVSEVLHGQGPDGSFCDIAVGRTRRGLLEQVKGGVPVGPYPGRLPDLLTGASRALAAIAQVHQPTIGFVSLAHLEPGPSVSAAARPVEVPLAVLIGPRGVHDLRLDPASLACRHDVSVLGRPRTPSLLVRMSDPDVGLWAQLAAFAWDLGAENIAAATGLDREV